MMQLKDDTLLYDGKYRVIRLLSTSEYGYTYEAMCTRTDTRVAIREFYLRNSCERHPYNDEVSASSLEKVELFDKMKRRFVDESRALFQFNHPNIVQVTDVFLQNGTAYYVMDYVEGLTLKQLVQQKGHLEEREALLYMDQLCDAIDYVHSKSRLQLDIRPANVIISPDGRVNLTDFGFSKRLDPSDDDPNVTSLHVSTNSYSPIELNVDSDATITPVSDIYSLGATLYKLLTGITPPDAAMLVDFPLEDLPSNISPNVALAIRKAMSPHKEDRPQSVRDFRRMLHAPLHASTLANSTHSHTAGEGVNDRASNTDTSTGGGSPYNSHNSHFSGNTGEFDDEQTQFGGVEDDNEPTLVNPNKHSGTQMSQIDFGFDSDGGSGQPSNCSYGQPNDDNTRIDPVSPTTSYFSGNNPPDNSSDPNNHWGNGRHSDNHFSHSHGVNTSADNGLIADSGSNDESRGNYGGSDNYGDSGNSNRSNNSDSSNSGSSSSSSSTWDSDEYDIYAYGKGTKKKSKAVLIAYIIAALLVVGGIGYWAYDNYFSGSSGSTPEGSSSVVDDAPGTTLGSVTQNDIELMGQLAGHLWVDLGLPSGTKWATTNVGAETPTDFGGYYAWGETDTKSVYSYENAATNEKPMGEIAGNPTFDAATKLWGESWRLPTKKQYDELLENCSYKWVDVDGVKGGLFTSRKNGQSIFFPAGGFCYGVITSDNDASYVGNEGAYWTDSPVASDAVQEFAYGLRLYGNAIQSIDEKSHRGVGRNIRAVAK